MAVILKTRARLRKVGKSSAIVVVQNMKMRKYSGRWVNVTITE